MKHLFTIVIVSVLFSILLAACLPKAGPNVLSTKATATNTSSLNPVSTEITATLVPAVLPKPEAAIGATFRYIDGTLLVAVPAGPFKMGRAGGSDNPEHTVTLSDFWIYSTKVTNRQYAYCVSAGICAPPDVTADLGYNDYSRFDDPVTGVDWNQAQTYCTYVSGRLPTEAEWEKAARGPDGNLYPWGNDAPTCDLLNFNNCVGTSTNVTTYPQGQSYYHALDMAGNAYEWVADWYDGRYYKTGPTQDPLGPKTGSMRSARSSGYNSTIDSILSSVRSPFNPDNLRHDLGFRCVVDDPTYVAPICEQPSIYGPAPSDGQSVQKNVPTNCPIISLDIAQQKCGSNSTYVTINSNAPGLTTVGGVDKCTLLLGSWDTYPQTYDCHAATTATISGTCTYSGLGDARCADHYNLDPQTGTCKWDGTSVPGNQCLAGYNFDSTNQCCSSTSGKKADYSLCAVGSTLTDLGNGQYSCVTISNLQTVTPISKDVKMPAVCQ